MKVQNCKYMVKSDSAKDFIAEFYFCMMRISWDILIFQDKKLTLYCLILPDSPRLDSAYVFRLLNYNVQ